MGRFRTILSWMERRLKYASYIRPAEHEALIIPEVDCVHYDERMFVRTHVRIENHFHQCAEELAMAAMHLADDKYAEAGRLLKRQQELLELAEGEMKFLFKYLDPKGFGEIRKYFDVASGKNSPGFLRILRAARSLRRVFRMTLASRCVTLQEIYMETERHEDLRRIQESILDFDGAFTVWRMTHWQGARRQLGDGTQGTAQSLVSILPGKAIVSLFPSIYKTREKILMIRSRAG